MGKGFLDLLTEKFSRILNDSTYYSKLLSLYLRKIHSWLFSFSCFLKGEGTLGYFNRNRIAFPKDFRTDKQILLSDTCRKLPFEDC